MNGPDDELKEGDAVRWETSQGTIDGTVVRRLTAPIEIKGHHVAASAEDPQYLVKSDRTGAEAAHEPSALRRR